MVRRTIAGILAATLLLALSAGHRDANAATINVACNATALIQAIETANNEGTNPGPDTLDLAAGCTYSLAAAYAGGENGLPTITSNITINGNGAVIARDPAAFERFRILMVTASGTLTIDRLTVTGGRAPHGPVEGAFGRGGGGIFVLGSLAITNSTISNNQAGNGTNSPNAFGAGGNGGNGGGIVLAGPSATITNSTIVQNSAGNGGAAPAVGGDGGDGGNGGGISAGGPNSPLIANSTITQNSAGSGGNGADTTGAGGGGGGVVDSGSSGVQLVNVTISGNAAGTGGGVPPAGGGVLRTSITVIKNSIIANSSSGGDCGGGSAVINSNNIASDGSCGSGFTQKTSGEINLAPLASNGGPTQTIALLPASAAIDAGDNATCAAAPVNGLDQRGIARPLDGDSNGNAICDIGAYEAPALQTGPQFTVNSTAPDNDGICHLSPGDCTIREAISAAIAGGPFGEIQLGNAQTYALTGADNAGNGLPVISNEIVIIGNGSTIARDPGAPLFRIFQVPVGGTLLLDSVTVSGGEATGATGDGGGIYVNGGQLHMFRSTVSGNRAAIGTTGINGGPGRHGGGIAISSAGSAFIIESTVNGNGAGTGGAGTELNGGPGGNGGAIALLGGTLNIERSLVNVNFAGGGRFSATGSGGGGGWGGGLYLAGGSTANISNTTIRANAAGGGAVGATFNGNGGNGGGIASPSSLTTLTNVTFSQNSVGAAGGPNAGNGNGSGIYGDGNAITARNTIMANGASGNCGTGSAPGFGSTNNIVQATDTSCGTSFTQRTLADINFGTFGNNGGRTATLPLLAPSAAIDAGNEGICETPPVSYGDQRGYPRPVDGDTNGTAICDVGAYEYCLDGDSDGPCDSFDNCPTTANANQADGDFDGPGDVCDNCPSLANFGQEDLDFDGPGDVCDNCPAVPNANQADFDADSLGDACDAEDDGDGYTDVVETGAPLCAGDINDDGAPVGDDTAVNDGCAAVGPGETVPQCSNSLDDDGDTFVNDGCVVVGNFSEAQFKVGTGSLDPCGLDGWPSDFVSGGVPDSTNKLTISDIASFLTSGPPLLQRRLDKNPGQPAFDSRWDLSPSKGALASWINIQDITTLLSGTTGNPPMFGNTRAFGKVCPFAP